jgi:hypothetical protein
MWHPWRVASCIRIGGASPFTLRSLTLIQVGLPPLRAAMPAQFVEAAALRVFLPLDDELMFVERDGASWLKANFRPKSLRNNRPRQPVHRKTEVVELPKVNIRADRPRLETSEKLFCLRLQNDTGANRIQRLLFGRTHPAILGRTILGFDDGVECVLPGSRGDAGISAGKVCLGDVEIQLRLAKGLVLRIEQGGRLGPVFCAETFLLSGFGIVGVEHSTLGPPVETESVFHGSNFLIRASQPIPSGRCLSDTQRTANCVSVSRARVMPGSNRVLPSHKSAGTFAGTWGL